MDMVSPEKLVRIIAAASGSAILLLVILVYRRVKPAAVAVPYVQHAAAVLGLGWVLPRSERVGWGDVTR